MAVARNGQVAVLLEDGRVLIVAGSGDDTAELYDPQTGAFGQTGPMDGLGTSGVTADLLPDGQVLVAGGRDNSLDQKPVAAAVLYDPETGKFAPTGSMAQARSDQTATLLPDGRVLIAGGIGSSGDRLASAELYDPKTGKFALTGSMVKARSGQTATQLPDGRVLLVGGFGTGAYNDPTPTSAELYDPKTGKFTPTGSMATRRWSGHTATLLKDGRVLVVGGNSSAVEEKPLASAELYDPKTGDFRKAASMAEVRDGQSATRLIDGRVLVAGGSSGHEAELYDPQADVFGITGPMVVARASQSATLLGDGRVLISGGSLDPANGSSAEVYQP
jgi:WD40 repeat protein